MKNKSIKVTCAIIERNGEILAAQRGEAMGMPLKWEFPGGKVEPGELERDCIIREIKEELGADIEIINTMSSHIYDYGIRAIELIPFICRLKSGDISIKEHKAIKWDKPESLAGLDWAEADIAVYDDYVRYIKGDLTFNG